MPSKREGVESDDETEKAPPLTVEEAKTGRSTCKSSGEKIEKGEIRVGMEAYLAGRMSMAWQKLSGFFDNCRLENCVRKSSGKCRATGHAFEKGEVRFVVSLGRDRPHKMFLTLDAAKEALQPVLAAVQGPKWDPTTIQGLSDITEEHRKTFYSVFDVPDKKAAAFDKKHPAPAADDVLASPSRKRSAAAKQDAAQGTQKKKPKRQKRDATKDEDEASDGSSNAEDAEEEATAAELAAQAEGSSGDEQVMKRKQGLRARPNNAAAKNTDEPVNEYEQQRLELIARNQARMRELNLMGAVAAITPPIKTKPTSTKGLHPRSRTKEPRGPRRVSLRQQGIASDGTKIEHEKRNGQVVVVNGEKIRYNIGHDPTTSSAEPVERHPKGDVAFESSRAGGDADERFVRLLAMQTASLKRPEKPADSEFEDVTCALLSKLSLAVDDVAKVIQKGVTHLSWHPRCDASILAAGDKEGHVSLWQLDHESFQVPAAAMAQSGAEVTGDVGSKDRGASLGAAESAAHGPEGAEGPEAEAAHEEDTSARIDDGIVTNLRPHYQYICGLRWVGGGGGASCLLTASYDGSLRRMDPGAGGTFSLLHSDASAEYSAMDATSDGASVWLGDIVGTVEAFDTRASNQRPSQGVPVSGRKINTLSVEPSEERVLAVAAGDGSVALWDLRKLGSSSEAIATVQHSRTCQSAYFAPDGSHRILSTSRDDTLRVWKGKGSLSEAVSIPHNNNTGRYISPFRAVWGAASDSIICGNMKRLVDVYDDSGHSTGTLASEHMTAIPSRVAVHAHLPLLAAATGSGRIHVFR